MDEVRLSLMLPAEITREREKLPLVFLPIGLLEWHGPHLPLGVDGINAERVAVGVAQRIGGVVLPVFYIGTERGRTRKDLSSYDLRDSGYVEGMDFPGFFRSPDNPTPAVIPVKAGKMMANTTKN